MHWRDALKVVGAFVAAMLLLPVGVDLQNQDGAMGVGLMLRPLGGVRLIQEQLAERAFVHKDRWIAFSLKACQRDDGTLAPSSQKCPGTIRIESGAKLKGHDLLYRGSSGERVLAGTVDTSSGPKDFHVGLREAVEEGYLTDQPPEKLRQDSVRAEFSGAVENGQASLGMSRAEVLFALGQPDRWSKRRTEMVFEYDDGPILAFDLHSDAVTELYGTEDRQAAHDLADALNKSHPTLKVKAELDVAKRAVVLRTPLLNSRGLAEADARSEARLPARGGRRLPRQDEAARAGGQAGRVVSDADQGPPRRSRSQPAAPVGGPQAQNHQSACGPAQGALISRPPTTRSRRRVPAVDSETTLLSFGLA